jgi:putative DNA primase/helicase
MNFERLDLSNIDWQSALPLLGVDQALIANPKRLGACPIEGEGKTRFRFVNKDGRGNWHCNQCGHGDGVRLVALVQRVSDTEAIKMLRELGSGNEVKGPPVRTTPIVAKPKDVSKIKKSLQRTWDESSVVLSGAVEQYINRRVPEFNMSWLAGSMRSHPGLYHFDEGSKKTGRYPAIVSKVVGLDSVPVTLHRTYLSKDGFKAPVSPDQVKKQMTGVSTLNGESIHLNSPVLQSRMLIVSEGIETGLALVASMKNRHEVWAALTAGNLSKLKVPRARFDSVYIRADRDPVNPKNGLRVGEHYAEILSKRLISEGFKVKISVPTVEGKDYADMWMEHCMKLKLVA